MNKLAVALAADSALTLSSPDGQLKVYPSTDKIFQLVSGAPVGVMVYGNAEFLGFPWETVIKEFRRVHGRKTYFSLDAYVKAFRRFLAQSKMFPDEVRDAEVSRLALSFIGDVSRTMEAALGSPADQGKAVDEALWRQRVDELLGRIEKQVLAYPRIEGIGDVAFVRIRRGCARAIQRLCHEEFRQLPLEGRHHRKIVSIATEFLSRCLSPQQKSGVVIAGFGEDEYTPHLRSFEVDGLIAGKLRFVQGQRLDISDAKHRACIAPFAQQEMVQTFVEGIGPGSLQFMEETTAEAVQGILRAIVDIIGEDQPEFAAEVEALWPNAGDQLLENLFSSWEAKRQEYWQPLLEMVAALPKDELASMSEALVNLTKLRRRVTPTHETVGGPVDVALITRGDGLVWVKRKHYFRAELNPRAIARYQSAHLEANHG